MPDARRGFIAGSTVLMSSLISWAFNNFSILFTCRCGEGLKHLMSIDLVQGYILGIPRHKLRLSKAIHWAGAPRKVSKLRILYRVLKFSKSHTSCLSNKRDIPEIQKQFRRFLHDLEDQKAVCKIISITRALRSFGVIINREQKSSATEFSPPIAGGKNFLLATYTA